VSSVESVPAVDPLADICCLHCGYSLRGLTEHRCPECGNPFDPEELASSYLPEWPRLMVWFLTACCLAHLFQQLSRVFWALGSDTPVSSLFASKESFFLFLIFQPATMIIIAPFAVLGLMRKIDWGRKVAVALFVLQAIPLLPVVIYLIVQLAAAVPYNGLDPSLVFEILPAWNLAGTVSLPALIIVWILCTRLCRRSLRRRQWDPPLLLPRNTFPPRGDWLFVLVALLAEQAVGTLASMTTCALWCIAIFDISWPSDEERWKNLFYLGSWMILSGVASLWLVWIARVIWRSPASTQTCLKSLFLLMIVIGAITNLVIGVLIRPENYSLSSPARTVFSLSAALTHLLGAVTGPYALYRYATKVLPPEAITRVLKAR